jgi:hypothetical protein
MNDFNIFLLLQLDKKNDRNERKTKHIRRYR